MGGTYHAVLQDWQLAGRCDAEVLVGRCQLEQSVAEGLLLAAVAWQLALAVGLPT